MSSVKLPSVLSPTLLEYMRTHPHLPKDSWYFIAAVTVTIINRPDEVPTIYRHTLNHMPTKVDGEVDLDEGLKITRRLRESLLKTSAVGGVPKSINSLMALKEVTPTHLQDDALESPTGRRSDICDAPSTHMLQRGQNFFDKVYGKISDRVTDMMNSSGTEDLDLIAKLMYGFVLSNTTLLSQADTSYVLIAALIPQDVRYLTHSNLRFSRG